MRGPGTPAPLSPLARLKAKLLPHLADPSAPPPADPYAILGNDVERVKLLEAVIKLCEPGREVFEFGWWRNLLYFLDRQWIYWDPVARKWNDKRLARWIPKPVTNIVRTTLLAVRATIQQVTPGVIVAPSGNTAKNLITAKTADDLEPLIAAEHGMPTVMMEADFTAGLFGDAYFLVLWDKDDPTHQQIVTTWKCAACQAESLGPEIATAGNVCPECGSTALTKTGAPGVPLGKGKTICVTPLELLLPMYAQKWEAVDRLIYRVWRPKHDVEESEDPAIVRQLTFTTSPSGRALQLYRTIATTSNLTLTPQTSSGGGTGQVEGIVEQHLYLKPSKKYPEGVYLRFLGENAPVVCHDEAPDDPRPVLPSKSKQGKPLWPWINYPYEPVKGRLYAQGCIDSIIQKQDQINQADSMAQLTLQRMGNPIWLEPKGSDVERLTGEPGLIVRYNAGTANNAKPERIPGENPASAVFSIREMSKNDAEEQSGTYDVIKGSKPSGVEAFSALQLLVERGQSRFGPVFKNRENAYCAWYTIALELERVHGPTQRIKAVLGPNHSWTFQTFQSAQLEGDIEIRVEDGSTAPKTTLAKRAALESARQMGLINPQNPDVLRAALEQLGMTTLMPALDADVNEALQEQDTFESWVDSKGWRNPQSCPLHRLPWHNDPVHLVENRKWMNSDTVRGWKTALDPAVWQVVQQCLANHLLEHQMAEMQTAQAQAAASAPPGATSPGAPGAPSPSPAGQPPHASGPDASQRGRDLGGVGGGRAMANSTAQALRPQAAPMGS